MNTEQEQPAKEKRVLPESITRNLREYEPRDFTNIPVKHIQYASGLTDTDGCFQIIKGQTPKIFIGQAEKGIDALHFMHDTFGGRIYLHKEGNENHQTSYEWLLLGGDAVKYAKLIQPYLLLKKREADIFVNFTVGYFENIHIATNTKTNEVLEFLTALDTSRHFNIRLETIYKKLPLWTDDWYIHKKYSPKEVDAIKKQRKDIDERLRILKTVPHDEIPDDIIPSIAWRAGVFDGEGTFDTYGKSSQEHSITQKYRPLLDLFFRLYGGSVYYRKGSDTFGWTVSTDAKRLLNDIAPYIHGKKKQSELLLNMKPGEGPQVHVLLREMKGNYTASTPLVDAINAGASEIRAGKAVTHTAPKRLPQGVFENGSAKTHVKAQIQYDKKVYCLGVFENDEADKAHELYLEYKNLISIEKRGGAKVDFKELRYTEVKKPKETKNGEGSSKDHDEEN